MTTVAVIGLGTAGAAALDVVARAGVNAIGIEQYQPADTLGSFRGETRLLRVGYAEGALYVPMARRAIPLWRATEERTEGVLFVQSGVVYAGPPSSPFLTASLASARAHGVEIDALTRAQREHLRPALEIPDDWLCCAEREGGFVFSERAVAALLNEAKDHGAEVRSGVACQSIVQRGEAVVVTTSDGDLHVDRCIVAAGAWTASLLPALAPLLHVERKTLHWFADPSGIYGDEFKPFLIDNESGLQVYGFPDCGTGVKVAEHTAPSIRYRTPDEAPRDVTDDDIRRIEELARPMCPALGPLLRSIVCLYPMSADGHFIIDAVPGMDSVFVAAGLSGHGFKFAPVMGEALANLALGRPQQIDLEPFRIARF